MKEPCVDCPNKVVDNYGYLCDLSCGKRSAWENYKAGIREVVEWLNASDWGRRKEYSWQAKLKEWGL